MERVGTLSDRLKAQIDENATLDELLLTVQMLQSELQHLKSAADTTISGTSVAMHIPSGFEENENLTEEKVFLNLQVDEAQVESELEQIRKSAESINSFSIKNKRPISFDPIEDIPTMIHQKTIEISEKKEINETAGDSLSDSLNEKLKQSKKELSDALKDTPIKDLKKAIGINDRFLYIKELFNGDEAMYERSIKTINGFSIYPEAEYWIRRELKTKLGWEDNNETVKQFDQLVKRRFSVI
jgi:hypothetical protein